MAFCYFISVRFDIGSGDSVSPVRGTFFPHICIVISLPLSLPIPCHCQYRQISMHALVPCVTRVSVLLGGVIIGQF